MTAESPLFRPDPVDIAKARAEYGEAVRAFEAAKRALREARWEDADLRRRASDAEQRVNRAAARLSSLERERAT